VLNYSQDTHRQRTVDWCDATGGTAAAFDFTLKGILQEAVGRREYWRLIDSQGRPPGVLGLWPSRAVTFLENHDTGGWGGWVVDVVGAPFLEAVLLFGGRAQLCYMPASCLVTLGNRVFTPRLQPPAPRAGSTLNHWPFPSRHLPEAYAYLLTHCGTPCVFYDHLYQQGLRTHILELLRIRKKHGIHAKSEVTIRKAYNELYAAVIEKKVAMKIGPADWRCVCVCVGGGGACWGLQLCCSGERGESSKLDAAAGCVAAVQHLLCAWPAPGQSHAASANPPPPADSLACPLLNHKLPPRPHPTLPAPPRTVWTWARRSGSWCTAASSLRCGRQSSE
jgi:hypothetical protein